MVRTITSTMAARKFSSLVNRVHYRGESFVVERGGEAVCRIGPVTVPTGTLRDFVHALRSGPRPDAEYLDIVELAATKQPKQPKSPWER